MGSATSLRLWSLTLFLLLPAVCLATRGRVSAREDLQGASLAQREQRLWRAAAQGPEFSVVAGAMARSSCEATQPPQALATPDPLVVRSDAEMKVTVSFIIGTDGRVHSPLILESTRPWEEKTVLRAVSSWRFRPATCNGVPTEAEGKVEFSSRGSSF